MIGENAYLGESARFAKVGSEAWGANGDAGGEVLFDGKVTLTSSGEGKLLGTPVGALAPEAGVDYDITINGTTKTGTATAMGDDAAIQLMYGEGDMIMYGSNSGSVMFMCTTNYGEAGENSLKVAKSE